jgi:glycosyltransferase involved in cell wall biosynthesis
MKVLVVTGIFPPDIGGPATYVPRIADLLTARGHDVHVVATAERVDPLRRQRAAWEVALVPRRPVLVRAARLVATIAKRAASADVVYAAGMHLESAIGAAIARRPLVVKVVGDHAWERTRSRGWTTTGFEEFQATRQSPAVEMLKYIRTRSLRRAAAVVVPSAYLARVVTRWGVEADRCRVVYNAVPGSSSATIVKRRIGSPLRVVSVCRLVPWKGVELLVRAMAEIPGGRLSVIGDGPLRQGLEEVADQAGVAGRVQFLGMIAPDAVREQLRQHDVFALASSYEGLPHVVLEAMQERLAVVATGAGGTPEVVRHGETGLLVTADVQSIADALRRLEADPALHARLVAGSAEMLAQRFSEDAMVEQTEAVLSAHVGPRLLQWSPRVQRAG